MYEVNSQNNGNYCFLKKIFIYLSTIMWSSSKRYPSDIIHLCLHFFQYSRYFSNSIWRIAFSSFSDELLISSMFVKRWPCKLIFIFRNWKKSHRANYGEYGSWGIVTVLFLISKLHKQAMKVGWSIIMQKTWIVFHKSGCFFSDGFTQTALNLYSLLTIWPHSKNSWSH